jgi:integrase
VKWAEQGGNRFTFHDIRAKALTDAKNSQTLASHSSASMTEHYIKQREFKKVTPLK